MFKLFDNKRVLPGLAGLGFYEDALRIVHIDQQANQRPSVLLWEERKYSQGESTLQVLTDAVRVYKLNRIRCNTVLGLDEYKLIMTEAPDVSAEELIDALRWQVKDLIDFSINEVTLDTFEFLTSEGATKIKSIYVVAARNDSIRYRTDLSQRASANLDSIDIPELALRNVSSLLPQDEQGTAMLCFDHTSGLLIITKQGVIYMSRRIDFGIDTIAESIEKDFYLERMASEIQRSLDYFERQLRQPAIASLLIAPTCKEASDLTDYLATSLGIAVSIFSLEDVIDWRLDMPAHIDARDLITLGGALRVEEVQ